MLKREARWLGSRLRKWPAGEGVVINVGSSSKEFRTVIQPWIEEDVFAPARACGIMVLHQDLSLAPGVDIAGDLLSDECQRHLRGLPIRGVVCSSVLEHVPDRKEFARAIVRLLPPRGRALISVPRRFPYHPDPIDTLYRPTSRDLCDLFAGLEPVCSEEVRCGRLPGLVLADIRRALRLIALRGGPRVPHRLTDWFPYLVRSFQVTCAEFRMTDSGDLAGARNADQV